MVLSSLKTKLIAFALILVLGLILSGFSLSRNLEKSYIKEFIIDYISKIRLEGTTDVNSFTCSMTEYKSRKAIEVTQMGECCKMTFYQTSLLLNVPELDCGKKGINKDLQKTLKADIYPDIQIKVIEVITKGGLADLTIYKGIDARVQTELTIANSTQRTSFDVQIKNLSKNKYLFSGKVPLKMTQFDIKPPTVLLGLISVNDQIFVSLEIEVNIYE